MRDRNVAYEIALAETMEAENYKDDFDFFWNLDDEILDAFLPLCLIIRVGLLCHELQSRLGYPITLLFQDKCNTWVQFCKTP